MKASRRILALAPKAYTRLLRAVHGVTSLGKSRNASRAEQPKRIAILFSRPQDLELLVNIHGRVKSRDDVSACVWLLKSCIKRDADILLKLDQHGIAIDRRINVRDWRAIARAMLHLDAFLNTRESTAGKYKLPDLLTDLANAAGVPTYTLQHGFENPGLTYYDNKQGPDTGFASKTILTWGNPDQLPAWVSGETRGKCVAVGCPKALQSAYKTNRVDRNADSGRPLVPVFENLQWRRYDNGYIHWFLDALQDVARQRTEFRFVLKSHPGATKNRSAEVAARLKRLENVEVIDYIDPALPRPTTPSLLFEAAGAITTPSTVALDAAMAGTPVAVTRHGLDLASYAPLDMLDSVDDWHRFLDRIDDEATAGAMADKNDAFLERAIVPGDAASRIVDLMVER